MIAELHSLHRMERLKYCCMICGNVSDAKICCRQAVRPRVAYFRR